MVGARAAGRRSARPVAVLASGGLDSSVLLAEYLRRGAIVQPVYVRSGLIWESVERYWLQRYLRALAQPALQEPVELQLPAADLYGVHWSVSGRGCPDHDAPVDSNYLPGRNFLLLSKVAVFCALHGIDLVALALLRGNPFPDATAAFFRSFTAAARRALRCRLRVRLPFRGLSKDAVIRRGAGLPLHLTFSCANPVARAHCGRCTKCAERRRAFAGAGVPDPSAYRHRTPGGRAS